MPYTHDESLDVWIVVTLVIPKNRCDRSKSATTSGPHDRDQKRIAIEHAGLHSKKGKTLTTPSTVLLYDFKIPVNP
jgi:hypothetical protein